MHTIFSYYDNGQPFQQQWTTTEIKSYVKALITARGYKPYPFDIQTRSHNNGKATEIDVINKKTGKISKCYLGFMFGSFHCEPRDQSLFLEAT